MSNKVLGKRLKQVRVELEKTQEEMAKLLLDSDNKGTISAYENGRLEISPKAKLILFTTLQVNKDWFESGDGEMFTTRQRGDISDRLKSASYGDIDKSNPGAFKKFLFELKDKFFTMAKSNSYTDEQLESDLKDLEEEIEFMKYLLAQRKNNNTDK